MAKYCTDTYGQSSSPGEKNCICGDGYIFNGNGSKCITYTQNCQSKYGTNSYGDKNSCYCTSGYFFNNNQCISSIEYCKLNYGEFSVVKIINGTSSCDCESGYVWNSNKTTCIKIDVETTLPLPTIILTPKDVSIPKKEILKKIDIKIGSAKESVLSYSIIKKVDTQKVEDDNKNNLEPIIKVKWYRKIFNWFKKR